MEDVTREKSAEIEFVTLKIQCRSNENR